MGVVGEQGRGEGSVGERGWLLWRGGCGYRLKKKGRRKGGGGSG